MGFVRLVPLGLVLSAGLVAGALLPGAVVLAQSPAAAAEVMLRPGDVLRIAVWQRPEFSGEFIVSLDGSIGHPMLRHVQTSGRTLADIERQLGSFLQKYDDAPAFVIEPLVRVAVTGEVSGPSVYMVGPRSTVAEVLALAGGTTERGDLRKVRVVRDGDEMVLDLSRMTNAMEVEIRSGDHILVPRRPAVFRDFVLPGLGVIGSVASILNLIRVF